MRGKRLQRETSLLLEIQTSATPAHVLCIHQACTSSILVWDQSEVAQTLNCVAAGVTRSSLAPPSGSVSELMDEKNINWNNKNQRASLNSFSYFGRIHIIICKPSNRCVTDSLSRRRCLVAPQQRGQLSDFGQQRLLLHPAGGGQAVAGHVQQGLQAGGGFHRAAHWTGTSKMTSGCFWSADGPKCRFTQINPVFSDVIQTESLCLRQRTSSLYVLTLCSWRH